MSHTILTGDCREMLETLPDQSVQCVVTSPPYFGLRDYGTAQWDGGHAGCDHSQKRSTSTSSLGIGKGLASHESAMRHQESLVIPYRDQCGKCGAVRVDRQIGLEPTLTEYIATMVDVFREVRRVLRDDGTLWLNIGDSYNAQPGQRKTTDAAGPKQLTNGASTGSPSRFDAGLKPKDLMMVPARLAIALQDDGWWLRSDIIWAKKAPMPESVRDRPTSAHEHIFLLTKSARYYYDAEAVAEVSDPSQAEHNQRYAKPYAAYDDRAADTGQPGNVNNVGIHSRPGNGTRNLRNVWHLGPEPFAEAHFATFPTEIPRRCILAGSREGDTVLDPFLGAGTTLLVADRLGRDGIGIELNPEYAQMAQRRIGNDAPLFSGGAYTKANKKRATKKQDDLGKQTYTGFNARWAARVEPRRIMMAWPHFPEDQLSLFDISAFDTKPEREDVTRGGRVTERSATIDRRRPCRMCGELKTDGLPCPHCTKGKPL
jgi:DNA modification methylase